MDDVTAKVCEQCQLVISNDVLTYGTHCYCKMPQQLTEACEEMRQNGNIAELNVQQVKKYMEEGVWPKELHVVVARPSQEALPGARPKQTPAKPPRTAMRQDSLDSHEETDDTVRILKQALEDAAKELAETERRHQAELDTLTNPKQLPAVTRFERSVIIAKQLLTDAEQAIEAKDVLEMVLVKDNLSHSIHKLEIDMQTTLSLLGDQNEVPVEYIMGFREESKNSIREFKNKFLELENRLSQLEKSNVVAATPSAQSTQWGVPTMRPTTGRWQMPVLTKMDQPPPVQFQYLPTQTKDIANVTAGAQKTPYTSQPSPQKGAGDRAAGPTDSTARRNLNDVFIGKPPHTQGTRPKSIKGWLHSTAKH